MTENDETRIDNIGPGLWWITHSLAANAQTKEGVKQFMNHVEYLKTNFPCEKCRPHIVAFFTKHPTEQYTTNDKINGKDVGLFRLTWIMHNEVNKRLNKKFFPFEKGYDIYFSGGCQMEVCPGTIAETASTNVINKNKNKFTLMRLNA